MGLAGFRGRRDEGGQGAGGLNRARSSASAASSAGTSRGVRRGAEATARNGALVVAQGGKGAQAGGGGGKKASDTASRVARVSKRGSSVSDLTRAGETPGQQALRRAVSFGILTAGPDTLCVRFGGEVFWAALREDGMIEFEGSLFNAPSTFALFAKRKINPSLQSDAGLRSVRYKHPDSPTLYQMGINRLAKWTGGPISADDLLALQNDKSKIAKLRKQLYVAEAGAPSTPKLVKRPAVDTVGTAKKKRPSKRGAKARAAAKRKIQGDAGAPAAKKKPVARTTHVIEAAPARLLPWPVAMIEHTALGKGQFPPPALLAAMADTEVLSRLALQHADSTVSTVSGTVTRAQNLLESFAEAGSTETPWPLDESIADVAFSQEDMQRMLDEDPAAHCSEWHPKVDRSSWRAARGSAKLSEIVEKRAADQAKKQGLDVETSTTRMSRRLKGTHSRRSLSSQLWMKTDEKALRAMDPHTLIACEGYRRVAEDKDEARRVVDAGDEDTQPFAIAVHAQAMIVCDVHAHTNQEEIIGFLAGRFREDDALIEVQLTVPVRSLEVENAGMNVEMDPEASYQAVSFVRERGLEIVGWYHSHPKFEPNPSIRDIENQEMYQKLFASRGSAVPFIGAIVCPYDAALPDERSLFTYFHVPDRVVGRAKRSVPMELTVYMAVYADGQRSDSWDSGDGTSWQNVDLVATSATVENKTGAASSENPGTSVPPSSTGALRARPVSRRAAARTRAASRSSESVVATAASKMDPSSSTAPQSAGGDRYSGSSAHAGSGLTGAPSRVLPNGSSRILLSPAHEHENQPADIVAGFVQVQTLHAASAMAKFGPLLARVLAQVHMLGQYYRLWKQRYNLLAKWRDNTRVEKLRICIAGWAAYLPMEPDLAEEFSACCLDILQAAWLSTARIKGRPVKRTSAARVSGRPVASVTQAAPEGVDGMAGFTQEPTAGRAIAPESEVDPAREPPTAILPATSGMAAAEMTQGVDLLLLAAAESTAATGSLKTERSEQVEHSPSGYGGATSGAESVDPMESGAPHIALTGAGDPMVHRHLRFRPPPFSAASGYPGHILSHEHSVAGFAQVMAQAPDMRRRAPFHGPSHGERDAQAGIGRSRRHMRGPPPPQLRPPNSMAAAAPLLPMPQLAALAKFANGSTYMNGPTATPSGHEYGAWPGFPPPGMAGASMASPTGSYPPFPTSVAQMHSAREAALQMHEMAAHSQAAASAAARGEREGAGHTLLARGSFGGGVAATAWGGLQGAAHPQLVASQGSAATSSAAAPSATSRTQASATYHSSYSSAK